MQVPNVLQLLHRQWWQMPLIPGNPLCTYHVSVWDWVPTLKNSTHMFASMLASGPMANGPGCA